MIQKNISSKNFNFGKNFINPDSVFIYRTNVIGVIAPNSQMEGHVWICSRRPAKKLNDLTEKEILDLWMTTHEVTKKFEESVYKVSTFKYICFVKYHFLFLERMSNISK